MATFFTSFVAKPAGVPPRWAAALLCATLAIAVDAGHDGRRIAQVLVLALPALLWLRLPIASRGWRAVRYAGVSGIVVSFLMDGAVRAFMQAQYRAAPDSTLVLAAVANTNLREAVEYAASQGPALAAAAAALLLGAGAALAIIAVCNRHQAPVGAPARWVMAVLLVVCVASVFSKPWRRHHPWLFWPSWAQSVQSLQAGWADQQRQRDELLENARAAGARIALAGPSTVVLVLTDSVNRDNMSLYGYPRRTTPQLAALHAAEQGRLLTLRHAWAVEAGTVASLGGLFSFGARDGDDPIGDSHHLLALARAAGYRVWWMSNHDDVAIEQQHAQLANSVELINREPGRSTSSLDGELLDCLEEALADPAPRKLIVVHLLGAHPHYRLRAPAAADPFPEEADAVDAEMAGEGRSAWLRAMRRDYDKALSYHDAVVARTLALTRQYAPQPGHAAWMFVSDHGQEVGHEIAHAGHSPETAAGYRIPALVWRHAAPFDAALGARPFRADWAGWTLADLMGLEWRGMSPERNVLHPRYGWIEPELPVRIDRFDR